MSKILALYTNELFKLSRKASTLVLLILMILACFLLPLLIKMNQDAFLQHESAHSDGNYSLTQQKTDYETRLAQIETDVIALGNSNNNDLNIYQLQMEKNDIQLQLEVINLRLENDITGSEKDGFVYYAISNLPFLQSSLTELNAMEESDRDAGWAERKAICEEGIELIYSLPKTKDFKAYVDFEKRAYQTNLYSFLDEVFKQILIEQNDLWYRLDPSGGTDGEHNYDDVDAALQTLSTLKYELYSGVTAEETMFSTKYTSLSPSKKAELEDKVAVLEYRIQENSLVLASESPLWHDAKSVAVSFGQFLITILLLVIAGSAISQEIATGSIKSLIIAPVRRWKIFTAKLLSLITTGIIAVLVLWVFSNIGTSVFFGTGAIVPYVFVSGGSVLSIPYWLYDLLNLFAGNISTIVYCTFAFMLSIITRNTALAVGVSIATLFTSSTAATIILALPFPHQLWMDFLPFMHFDLTGYLFPFSSFMKPLGSMMSYELTTIRPSLQFSIVYLLVLLFCMLYISYDSFTRRDIK